jgi:hypothetical protein
MIRYQIKYTPGQTTISVQHLTDRDFFIHALQFFTILISKMRRFQMFLKAIANNLVVASVFSVLFVSADIPGKFGFSILVSHS